MKEISDCLYEYINKEILIFFRVRLREDKKTYALSLSHKGETRHYMIEKKDKFHILGGPKFDCIMMVRELYQNNRDI